MPDHLLHDMPVLPHQKPLLNAVVYAASSVNSKL